MRKPLIGILIAVGVVGAQLENTTDKRAIEAVVARFMEAWNHRHDAHAFAALFTEDADFTNVRGTHAHGRTAVEEFHAPCSQSICSDNQDIVWVRVGRAGYGTNVQAVDAPSIRLALLAFRLTYSGKFAGGGEGAGLRGALLHRTWCAVAAIVVWTLRFNEGLAARTGFHAELLSRYLGDYLVSCGGGTLLSKSAPCALANAPS